MQTIEWLRRREIVVRARGRRYRIRWVGRRRRAPMEDGGKRLIVIAPVCPRCGSDDLAGDGEPRVGYRVMRYPMACRRCSCRVEVAWATPPALRDVYCAERAGVPVAAYRRFRDAARALYLEDDRHGA